jgi:hypothetical protein
MRRHLVTALGRLEGGCSPRCVILATTSRVVTTCSSRLAPEVTLCAMRASSGAGAGISARRAAGPGSGGRRAQCPELARRHLPPFARFPVAVIAGTSERGAPAKRGHGVLSGLCGTETRSSSSDENPRNHSTIVGAGSESGTLRWSTTGLVAASFEGRIARSRWKISKKPHEASTPRARSAAGSPLGLCVRRRTLSSILSKYSAVDKPSAGGLDERRRGGVPWLLGAAL